MIYSAGIIPFRINGNGVMEFFLGHPGGDKRNYWSFLKGQVKKDEKWQDAAIREFKEESGLDMGESGSNLLISLGTARQNKQKVVVAYGLYYPNIDENNCHSNMAENGLCPEIDKYKWMTYDELKNVTHKTHIYFYETLININKEYTEFNK